MIIACDLIRFDTVTMLVLGIFNNFELTHSFAHPAADDRVLQKSTDDHPIVHPLCSQLLHTAAGQNQLTDVWDTIFAGVSRTCISLPIRRV